MNSEPLNACANPALPAPCGIRLTILPEHDCPYLPDRIAQSRGFAAASFVPEVYHDLMNVGFRRSGTLFYQPICRGCRECTPIRIPVDRFVPSKSQRRALRHNADLIVEIAQPVPTTEKFDLYRRYASQRHRDENASDPVGFCTFLYNSPVNTLEFAYRDSGGKLLAIGLCDICTHSLSSVYFYYDPAESRRSLGTCGALREIQFARDSGIPHYYLGYWIADCATMRYKTDFRPNELLYPDGIWRENESSKAS